MKTKKNKLSGLDIEEQ